MSKRPKAFFIDHPIQPLVFLNGSGSEVNVVNLADALGLPYHGLYLRDGTEIAENERLRAERVKLQEENEGLRAELRQLREGNTLHPQIDQEGVTPEGLAAICERLAKLEDRVAAGGSAARAHERIEDLRELIGANFAVASDGSILARLRHLETFLVTEADAVHPQPEKALAIGAKVRVKPGAESMGGHKFEGLDDFYVINKGRATSGHTICVSTKPTEGFGSWWVRPEDLEIIE